MYLIPEQSVGADSKNSGSEVCYYPFSVCSVSAFAYAGQIFLLQETDAIASVNTIKTNKTFAFFMGIEIYFIRVNG